jgi:long-chain acyl-CoA synthetase
MKTLSALDFFRHNASMYPDSPAAKFGEREFSHRQLFKIIAATAHTLAGLGVVSGSRVAIYSDDDFDLCRCYGAVWALGATAVPLNISNPDATLAAIEASVTPGIGLYSGSFVCSRARAFPMFDLSAENASAADALPNAPVAQVQDAPHHDASAHCVILFTSGSSGVPKAIPLSPGQLANNALGTSKRLGAGPDDRILITTPLYTTSSLIHLLTMLSAGASIVVERGFLFGSSLVSILEQNNCTGFGGVPANFIRLAPLTSQSAPPDRLRFLMNSGEHLPVPVLKTLRSNWPGVDIHCAYGLTEVAGRLCMLDPARVDAKPGSVGQPLEGMNVRVLDEYGAELGAGATGQVHVDGPNLMAGYLNNPEANLAMTKNGFATGDYGRVDDDGDLFLEGRSDDIVKVGGEKVSMLAIESAACALDFVDECAAIAAEDERIGIVPWLYFVSRHDAEDVASRIKGHLRSELPANHVPMRLVRVDALPKTASGKIARKKLSQAA